MGRKELNGSKDLEFRLATPVIVCGYGESGAPFKEYTQTVTVNAMGCLIQLTTPVTNEQLLVLKNVKTEEEILCHTRNCATNHNGLTLVKIFFVRPSEGFWKLRASGESSIPTEREEK
ncbi:MAG TPA: hypothetical protein VK709_13900 [Candidatus Saccharimonadales bacterium]|jgi:hypothetical protein|nr:hypothetical protein [Candidatus Saccharimonadales bacterium]